MADPFTVGLSVAAAADDANPDISGISGDVEVLAAVGANQSAAGTPVNIRIVTGEVVNIAGTQTGTAAELALIKDIASQPFYGYSL